MRPNNAVIFHVGRCGSTVICNVLNQNALIECRGEIFNPYMRKKQAGETIPNASEILRQITSSKTKTHQIFEIKFLQYQHPGIFGMKLPELLSLFHEHGFHKFIVLERSNYLRRMVSHCVAQQTKVYQIKGDGEAQLNQIYLNTKEIDVGSGKHSLIGWLNIISDAYTDIRTLLTNESFLEVGYEKDIQISVLPAYVKICEYLEVRPEEVKVQLKRTNPFPLQKIILNYDEVFNLLKDSPYEWMLAED